MKWWFLSLVVAGASMFVPQVAASTLDVRPMEQAVTIAQGSTRSLSIGLANSSSQLFTYEISKELLSAGSGTSYNLGVYHKAFNDAPEEWLKLYYDLVVLEAGDDVTYDFDLGVPETAMPGTYLYRLHFQGVDEGEGHPQSFSALLRLQVVGTHRKTLSLDEVVVGGHLVEKENPLLLPKISPVSVELMVSNTGTLPQELTGQLRLREGGRLISKIGYVQGDLHGAAPLAQQLGDYIPLQSHSFVLMPQEVTSFSVPIRLLDMDADYDWEDMELEIQFFEGARNILSQKIPLAFSAEETVALYHVEELWQYLPTFLLSAAEEFTLGEMFSYLAQNRA